MGDNESSTLRKAIENTNPEILRRVMNDICESSPETRKLIASRILVNMTSEGSPSEDAANGKQSKRKLDSISGEGNGLEQRFQTCLQCQETYDITNNDDDFCIWHKGGRKEVINEPGFWDQHDPEERSGGSPTDHTDDPEYARGFKWTCCKGYGDSKGCTVTKHRHDGEQIPEPKHQKLQGPVPEVINLSKTDDDYPDVDDPNDDYKKEVEAQREIDNKNYDTEWYGPDDAFEHECCNCGKIYIDFLNNDNTACLYHPGRKKIDPKCDLSIEEKENLDDDSEWMIWSCCDAQAREDGCENCSHFETREDMPERESSTETWSSTSVAGMAGQE